MEIHFDDHGKICSGSIENYLLEKTRVVQQAPTERNYVSIAPAPQFFLFLQYYSILPTRVFVFNSTRFTSSVRGPRMRSDWTCTCCP